MPIISRKVAAVLAADPTTVGTVDPGVPFSKILGFTARNWASIAKAGAGTDTSVIVKFTDDSGIIYLENAARDYATALKATRIAVDDTATGLTGPLAVDATGATVTAGSGGPLICVGPVQVIAVGGTTATDYFEIEILFEV
jgi:hypothetical protein